MSVLSEVTMSDNNFDITPSPRVLRMLGQIEFKPWQCLAELIDNSIEINKRIIPQSICASFGLEIGK